MRILDRLEFYKKLSDREKTLINMMLVIGLLAAFTFLYIRPFLWSTIKQRTIINNLKSQILTQSQHLDLMKAKSEALNVSLSQSKKAVEILKTSFPQFLAHLAINQIKLNLDVVSISTPNPPEEVKKEDKIPASKQPAPPNQQKLEKKEGTIPFKYLLISMNLKTNYTDLGQYLHSLRSYPFVYKIDSLKIKKENNRILASLILKLVILERT